MFEIFRTIMGSHLYGTATPSSDVDWKCVFVPTAREILLGRGKESFNKNDKEDDRSGTQRKNDAGEMDIEYHSLRKFLLMAAQGQTVALDMLFATPLVTSGKIDGKCSDIWMKVWENRDRLASKQAKSFIDYATQQAAKFGVKGSRMAAAEKVAEFFAEQVSLHGQTAKCGQSHHAWIRSIEGTEHCLVDEMEQPGNVMMKFFECCNKKALFSTTLKEAHAIFAKIHEGYGHRARKAKESGGVDWKALSHAMRIGRQAIEYLDAGHLTFPRPEAAHILAIKNGELPYDQVGEEIEVLLDEVRAAADRSALPERPDQAWIDDFVMDVYGREVASNSFKDAPIEQVQRELADKGIDTSDLVAIVKNMARKADANP